MVAAYDPRYILQFALHGLSEGCIDTEEFVSLGFLAMAITSVSSSEEGMRKLGYKILAKYMASLEVCHLSLVQNSLLALVCTLT